MLDSLTLWSQELDGKSVLNTSLESKPVVRRGRSFPLKEHDSSLGVTRSECVSQRKPEEYTGRIFLSIHYLKYVSTLKKAFPDQIKHHLSSKGPSDATLKTIDLCLMCYSKDDGQRLLIGDHRRDLVKVNGENT